MKTLVIYESMFGNTQKIARAIASGLSEASEVEIIDVSDAPPTLPAGTDLLIVGGPTHAFSMSRSSTRQDAADRGGAYTDVPEGIREWLAHQDGGGTRFIAFDTRVDMPLVPGAASRAASRSANKHGFHVLPPQSFVVEGYTGPLRNGELERAAEWGRHTAENEAARAGQSGR